MNLKLRVWHPLLVICVLILITRIELVADIYSMLFLYISLLFSNTSSGLNQFNFELADHFLSAILIVLVPVFSILYRKTKLLSSRLNFSSLIIIILGALFIFSPVIAAANPDFQKDLRVTKLLPPFSSKYIIRMEKKSQKEDDFFEMRKKVIKTSFDESVIFADSVKWGKTLIYFQKGRGSSPDNPAGEYSINVTSKTFYLGTDEYGRDVFTRLVYGARISLFVGLGAVLITLILGVVLGFTAGYIGGITDTILSRFTDMLLAFPIIFLIILILALFGNSLLTVIVVLGYSGWMSLFKIVRGEVISVKNKEYFISAKLAGLSGKNILLKEIMPVIAAPVIVNLVFQYGLVILAESALSFLGLGTGSMYPSWGGMIESGQEYLTEAWWLIFFPGIALFITLFTANNLGKDLNVYYNPRLKHD